MTDKTQLQTDLTVVQQQITEINLVLELLNKASVTIQDNVSRTLNARVHPSLAVMSGDLNKELTQLKADEAAIQAQLNADNTAPPPDNPPPSVSVPGKPVIVVTAGDQTAEIVFAAPASNGAPITAYKAYVNGNLAATSAGSPIKLGNLSDGTAYSITLTATNSAGEGPASLAVVVTPVAPPPSGGPVPGVAAYAGYKLVGNFNFAAMAASQGKVPSPFALTVPSQIMGSPGTTSAALISIVPGVGIVLQVGSQTEGTGIDTDPVTTPGGGFYVNAPYYRETVFTMAVKNGKTVNHPSSWTLTTRQGDDANIDGEVDDTEGGWQENTATVHNGPESQMNQYGPDFGVTQGKHKVAVFNDGTQVTFWLDDKLVPNNGQRANPAKFPEKVPADAKWYPLHCNIPAAGLFGATSETVVGAAGEYIVESDYWWVP